MGKRWMAIAETYDIQSSSYHSSAPKKSNEVNDSLDVCSYRIIQNYAVNKVPMSHNDYVRATASNESASFDLSNSVCDFHFMDQSTDDLAINNMEDTLDVCNYRRSDRNNLSSILSDADSTLVYDDVIAKYSCNKSIIDAEHMDEANESMGKMEDTLDVCNYRRRLAMQSLTPQRYTPCMSLHFNKFHVPFAHFSPSPIPTSTSSTVNSSSFMSSDQSDDNINHSSE